MVKKSAYLLLIAFALGCVPKVARSTDAMKDWVEFHRQSQFRKAEFVKRHKLTLSGIVSLKQRLIESNVPGPLITTYANMFKKELKEAAARRATPVQCTIIGDMESRQLQMTRIGPTSALETFTIPLDEYTNFDIEAHLDLDGDLIDECVIGSKMMGNAMMASPKEYSIAALRDEGLIRIQVPTDNSPSLDTSVNEAYLEAAFVKSPAGYLDPFTFAIVTTDQDSRASTQFFRYVNGSIKELGEPWHSNGKAFLKQALRHQQSWQTTGYRNQLQRAKTEFEKCLASVPIFPNCMVGLGWVHWHQKNWSRAIELWTRVKMLDPNRKDVNEPLSSAKLSLAGKPATWPPPLTYDGAVKQWRAINHSAGDVCVETDKETHKKLQLIEYQKRPNSPPPVDLSDGFVLEHEDSGNEHTGAVSVLESQTGRRFILMADEASSVHLGSNLNIPMIYSVKTNVEKAQATVILRYSQSEQDDVVVDINLKTLGCKIRYLKSSESGAQKVESKSSPETSRPIPKIPRLRNLKTTHSK